MIHLDDVAEEAFDGPDGCISFRKVLTPALPRPGRLGMNLSRVPPGRSACPLHAHRREDEIFFVLSGRGVFRYGEHVRVVRAGDTLSCPAGSGIAHQLAHPFDADLVYLAIGLHDPHEVVTYPDSGQVLVRSLGRNGFLTEADYSEGEPAPLRIMTTPVGNGGGKE